MNLKLIIGANPFTVSGGAIIGGLVGSYYGYKYFSGGFEYIYEIYYP